MIQNNYTGKILKSALFVVLLAVAGCTKLDETLYDRITSENFLQTKNEVTRDF